MTTGNHCGFVVAPRIERGCTVFDVRRGRCIVATAVDSTMAEKIARYFEKKRITSLFRWRLQPAAVRVAFISATRMTEPNLPYRDH
jgi:hypothetical protein